MSSHALTAVLCTALALPSCPRSEPAVSPYPIGELPWAVFADTLPTTTGIDRYDCAPGVDAGGAELVFELTLAAPALVSAWLAEETPAGVDLYLLDELPDEPPAARCRSRGDRLVEAELPAGISYIAVDGPTGTGLEEVVLQVDALGAAERTRVLGDGVVWRSRRHAELGGGPQVTHVLEVDLQRPGVRIEAVAAAGCQRLSELARATGAVAAVNGGYFAARCTPVSLLQTRGQVRGHNARDRSAFGIGPGGVPLVARIPAGVAWPEARDAHGGGPLLLAEQRTTGPADWTAEGFTDPAFLAANPRTWAGIDAAGRALFGTVDGRSAAAGGMSLAALGDWTLAEGALSAVNLDGGGSTTLWIAGFGDTGVANQPSDGVRAGQPHGGERAVSGGWLIFARPPGAP